MWAALKNNWRTRATNWELKGLTKWVNEKQPKDPKSVTGNKDDDSRAENIVKRYPTLKSVVNDVRAGIHAQDWHPLERSSYERVRALRFQEKWVKNHKNLVEANLWRISVEAKKIERIVYW